MIFNRHADGNGSVELKFVTQKRLGDTVLCVLDHFCLPDSKYPFNRVSSIYYDTPSLDAYREKANGDYLKRKLRLRWYEPVGGANSDGKVRAYLEVKAKTGSLRKKDRMVVDSRLDWLKSIPLDAPWLQWLHYRYRRDGHSEEAKRRLSKKNNYC